MLIVQINPLACFNILSLVTAYTATIIRRHYYLIKKNQTDFKYIIDSIQLKYCGITSISFEFYFFTYMAHIDYRQPVWSWTCIYIENYYKQNFQADIADSSNNIHQLLVDRLIYLLQYYLFYIDMSDLSNIQSAMAHHNPNLPYKRMLKILNKKKIQIKSYFS